MKKISLIIVLLFIALLSTTYYCEKKGFEEKKFGIEGSQLYYSIGKGELRQYRYDTLSKEHSHLHTWKIPYINQIDDYDIFLIIEQNRIRNTAYYTYTESVTDSSNLFYHYQTIYTHKGKFTWDEELQRPIMYKKSNVNPPIFHKELRIINNTLFILVIIILFILFSKYIILYNNK